MNVKELNETVISGQKGDISAFEKLYDEFYEPMRFYIAKRIGNVDQAKDLAQDTFVTAMEKIKDLKSPEAFKVWLYTIANNITNNYFKEINHFSSYETSEELDSVLEQAEEYSEPMYVPHDYLDNKETQMEVRKAIDDLSPDRRSILIMFYFENMRMKEIAAAMNINENAVGHRLTEARKQISKKLKALGGKNLALVPLPLVMQAIEDAADCSGGSAFVGRSTIAAVAGSSVRRVIVSAAAALAIGGGIYAHLLFRDNTLGDVRLPDNSASETVTTSPSVTERSDFSEKSESVSQQTNALISDAEKPQDQNPLASGNATTSVTARESETQTRTTTGRNGIGTNAATASTTRQRQAVTAAPQSPQVQRQTQTSTSEAPINSVVPSSLISAQQAVINKAFPRTDSEYCSILKNAGTISELEQADLKTLNNDIFSFAENNYLPAGGYFCYYDGGTTDQSDDIYVFMLPTKKINKSQNSCYYITSWISYRHNYSSANAYDSYNGLNPFPTKNGEVSTQGYIYRERESGRGGVLVERCTEIVIGSSDAPIYGGFSFGLTQDAESKIDLDNLVLLNRNIPKSAELSIVDYIRSNPTSFTRLNSDKSAANKRNSLPIY